MSRTIIFAIFLLLFLLVGLIGVSLYLNQTSSPVSPLASIKPTPTPKPLLKYSFETLKTTPPKPSLITLDSVLESNPRYQSYLFSFLTDGKTMTGLLNLPQSATPSAGFPVIVMFRGYVDPANYQTGMGTKNAAAYFASRGYVTLSPDFLGYGQSDSPPENTLAARLEKPKQMLDLLASLPNLKFINPQSIGLWGHSNGGQIALSVLEITSVPYPTSLWAPVSKSFPYSILYYTDESEDQGKELRRVLAEFESDYDVYDFSIDRYWGYITAPLIIHQGDQDDAVPVEWSESLVSQIKPKNQDITLHLYKGADHNLRPSWDQVVERDLDFFKKHLLN